MNLHNPQQRETLNMRSSSDGFHPATKHGPVLYVEDDDNDVLFMQKAYQQAALGPALKIASDGQEAIGYLSGCGPFADREQNPLPCLVLLDLNLPFKTGFEVLAWIRLQEQFKTLPVIIYSASAQQQDRQRAADMGANEYCVKPVDRRQIVELLKRISERWLVTEPAAHTL